jgi:hypothetical protein
MTAGKGGRAKPDPAPKRDDEKLYVIPISCWQARTGTGIPADEFMYPGGCPDPDWCRGNRSCFWQCKGDGEEPW